MLHSLQNCRNLKTFVIRNLSWFQNRVVSCLLEIHLQNILPETVVYKSPLKQDKSPGVNIREIFGKLMRISEENVSRCSVINWTLSKHSVPRKNVIKISISIKRIKQKVKRKGEQMRKAQQKCDTGYEPLRKRFGGTRGRFGK